MVKKMRTNQMMMTKGILAQSLFKKHLKLLFGASEFAGNHITCKLLTVETKKIIYCFCILLATIELNLRISEESQESYENSDNGSTNPVIQVHLWRKETIWNLKLPLSST